MPKHLVIVFVKNNQPGKVKTRLAKIIGNQSASDIYAYLVSTTLNCVDAIKGHKHIYFSDYLEDDSFSKHPKFIQQGEDLGERMQNAFKAGFENDFENIVLIGSDLPDISASLLSKAFAALRSNDIVFGPAKDGGYYLVGMKRLIPEVFQNKPWSKSILLEVTLKELAQHNLSVALLETLNDIDTFEDLKQYPKLLNMISEHG